MLFWCILVTIILGIDIIGTIIASDGESIGLDGILAIIIIWVLYSKI